MSGEHLSNLGSLMDVNGFAIVIFQFNRSISFLTGSLPYQKRLRINVKDLSYDDPYFTH